VDSSEAMELTTYVVTRWYRAPELMMADAYSASVDIWSAGCIMAELVKRRALFPGKNTLNQLELITAVMGSMTQEDISKFGKPDPKAVKLVLKMPHKVKRTWVDVLPDGNPSCLDLLGKMLVYDPNARITAAEALEHPYLKELHNPDEDDMAHIPFDFDWEHEVGLTVDDVKKLIHDEIAAMNPPVEAPTAAMASTTLETKKNPVDEETAVVHGSLVRMLRKQADADKLLVTLQSGAAQCPLDFADSVHRRTLLHWASLHGRLNVVTFLCENGVPIGAPDANSRSPLVLSLTRNFGGPHVAVAEKLVEHGALPAPDSPEAGELLLEIAGSGVVSLMETVLRNGYSTDFVSASGENVMLSAAKSGSIEMINLLRTRGLALKTHDHQRHDTVMRAATSGNVNLISTLLEENLDINSVSDTGMTPLLFAAQAQDVQMVEFLLMSGAVNNRFTELGRSVVDLLGQEVILDRLVALSQRNAELEEKIDSQ